LERKIFAERKREKGKKMHGVLGAEQKSKMVDAAE
jgi:hypothetical protein